MSNLKTIPKSITDISKDNENFLKEFSRDFYRKIIDVKDLNTFKNTLNEWVKNVGNTKPILELMKNHKENGFWFSSIIGFFYQYGIGCNVNKDKALELYLLSANNDDDDEFLNQK